MSVLDGTGRAVSEIAYVQLRLLTTDGSRIPTRGITVRSAASLSPLIDALIALRAELAAAPLLERMKGTA